MFFFFNFDRTKSRTKTIIVNYVYTENRKVKIFLCVFIASFSLVLLDLITEGGLNPTYVSPRLLISAVVSNVQRLTEF